MQNLPEQMSEQHIQPIMLCPVQLVCDPRMMITAPSEPIQTQPLILNVQNIPPWLQRPQNVVYYQQIPNQYNPYNQIHTVQNHIPYYVPQERPTYQRQSQNMPVLKQILNQKPLSFEKPQMLNRQVQTEPAKPQLITVNPIQNDRIDLKNGLASNVRAVYRPAMPRNTRPNFVNPYKNLNFEANLEPRLLRPDFNRVNENMTQVNTSNFIVNNAKNISQSNLKEVNMPIKVTNGSTDFDKTKLDTGLSKDKIEIINEENLRNTIFTQARRINEQNIRINHETNTENSENIHNKVLNRQSVNTINSNDDNNGKLLKNGEVMNTNVEKDREKKIKDRYVLTHVLDGHVIQESNVAFPVLKPKCESKNSAIIKNLVDLNNFDCVPILPVKYLHNMITNEDSNQQIEKDNPFMNLKKSTVKSWSMNDLSNYLNKYNWKETATVLREEEIDGESLLLANKQQLINIGVCEPHADFIHNYNQNINIE